MIYDKRAELARYFGLSPNLDAAIRFLQTTDLTALPMGRTEIPGGDIYYNHFTYTTALISQASPALPSASWRACPPAAICCPFRLRTGSPGPSRIPR